jgi:hypothetical protein
MPPIEWLRDRYYLADDGSLRHAATRGKARAGDPVGTVHKKSGYVHTDVNHDGVKKKLRVHRIVQSMVDGAAIPDEIEVDHGDRDRSNNRAPNLVKKSRVMNQRNTLPVIRAKGYTKVIVRGLPKFRAMIKWNGRSFCLGVHEHEQDAARAYRAAVQEVTSAEHANRMPSLQNRPDGASDPRRTS